jgi:hypothetical protein
VDTSTWQTYRNEEYGFEFKYPVSYKGFKLEIFKDTGNGLPTVYVVNNGDIGFFFKLSMTTAQGNLAEELSNLAIHIKDWYDSSARNTAPQNVSVAGIPAARFLILIGDRTDVPPASTTNTWWVYNNVRYVFTTQRPEDDSDYMQLYDQALSTFKFTK